MEILELLILLFASAYFSATELSFVVSNKIKIELRARKHNFIYKNIYFFVKNPQEFFSTILISNNIVNIAFSSIIALLLLNYFHFDDLTILLISSFLILFFGELLPKYFAREYADGFLRFSIIPLKIIFIILFPFVKIISLFSNFLTRTSSLNEENINSLFDKDDMHSLIHEGMQSGNFRSQDSDYVIKALELSDKKAYESMIPRTDIIAVEINNTIDELRKIFIESGFSKIPVYKDTIDNIIGFVHVYDLFKNPSTISSIVREITFVPATKRLIELLNIFLEKRMTIVIVVDEFGGTAGLISLEDIIEEMIGEIHDEYDTEELVFKKINENSFVLSGRISLDRLRDEFEVFLPEGDYETISGFITTHLGEIPSKNSSVELNGFRFLILKSDNRKIDLIKMTRL